MPSPTPSPQPHLWTRDGHLTALALDQHLCADLSDAERAVADDHLSTCATCRAVLAEIQGFHDAQPLPPLPWLVAPSTPVNDDADDADANADVESGRSRASMRWAWGGGAGLLAAAAAISLMVWLGAPAAPDAGPQLSGGSTGAPLATYVVDDSAQPDDIRIKGAPFSVEVLAQVAPSGARRVLDGDAVSPGDRLGFKVFARKPGYVMILGVDERGQDYLCYPQHPGAIQAGEVQAASIQAADQPVALNAAVRLDDALGQEHLIGLLCDAPFALSDVRAALSAQPTARAPLPALRAGCAQWEMTLNKRAAPSQEVKP
jgi:hypothetical protein